MILIFISFSSKADSISKQNITENQSGKNTELEAKLVSSEAKAYKLLYENSKENNQELLSTVQWTIGLSIGFLVAILGGQIFFNWRINKKEIDYIKKDIEEKIGELKAELLKSLTDENRIQETKITSMFDKTEKELLDKINAEFEKNNKFIELNNKMKDFEIDSAQNNFKTGIKELKINIEKIEGDIWKIKGVESNALSCYLRTALLQLELKREVKYILDDIISILTNIEEIHENDLERLEKLLSQLTIVHSEQKEKIEALYRDKPVFKFVERPKSPYGFGSFLVSNIKYIKNKPLE